MEKITESKEVLDFLRIDEYPHGDGYGYGYGDGHGYGYGDGYGDGDGDGSGDGSGKHIKYINGQPVYLIDSVSTLIDSAHGNYAKGRILRDDLTTAPCYIAKCGNYFAHGDTLKAALDDATEKYNLQMPLEDRIRNFKAEFPDAGSEIPATRLFSWHHILTGSCLMGRKEFCREHGINVERDSFTVREFVHLTKNSYGSDAIRALAEAYGINP